MVGEGGVSRLGEEGVIGTVSALGEEGQESGNSSLINVSVECTNTTGGGGGLTEVGIEGGKRDEWGKDGGSMVVERRECRSVREIGGKLKNGLEEEGGRG